MHISPEATTVCGDPPIHNFTGQRKNLTDPKQTNNYAAYVFLRKYKDKQIFVDATFYRSRVFNPAVKQRRNLNVTKCPGYD
jgi:hypothetical protein